MRLYRETSVVVVVAVATFSFPPSTRSELERSLRMQGIYAEDTSGIGAELSLLCSIGCVDSPLPIYIFLIDGLNFFIEL